MPLKIRGMNAGIDDIAIFIPKPYVHYMDFAAARGISPEKLEKGIGVKAMAIPDSDEDTATMAATACLRLMKKNNLSPKDIGRIEIATECGLDQSKALNSYTIGMLEQVYGKWALAHCGGRESKFACVSGSWALRDCWTEILAGENNGKASIVVMSDIAKYDIGSPGEYTQGAGAVALLVKESPRIISLDRGVASWVISDDYDFYRPHGHKTPVVNGKYSLDCYVEQVARAFAGFKRKALETRLVRTGLNFISAIDYFAFHLPFPKMGRKALERILAEEYVEEKMAFEAPLISYLRETHGDERAIKEILKLKNSEAVFRQKVEPSVLGCAHVGNIYTGSVFLSLASIIDNERLERKDIAGKRIVFLSYGSGSSAVVYSGVIGKGHADAAGKGILMPALENRNRISIEQYEALHKGEAKAPVAEKRGQFVLEGVDGNERRNYRFIEYG